MEQTDLSFKAFIRFLLDALREVQTEQDADKRNAKMTKILENLQKILEN